MERILKQRDRLLGISARLVGLVGTGASLVLLALCDPRPGLLLLVAPGYAVLVFALVRIGATRAMLWPALAVGAGLVSAVLVRFGTVGAFDGLIGQPAPFPVPTGSVDAVRLLLAVSIAAVSIVLTISLGRMIVLVGAFGVTLITTIVLFAGDAALGVVGASVLASWFGLTVSGSVLSAALLRAARRVSSIGRAHRSERQASETEAQRRQGARLLHDTVLATLTLLAHSGVGVSREALRRQAGDDARLLRQLRLSPTPISMSGTSDGAKTDADGLKSDSLQAVRARFERLGLDVSWHGAGTVSLRPDRLDAFLLALSECLENVRRHSGVEEAHVTITDDEASVRALVTDNGVGFEPAAVPAGKLGYRESIVGRIEEAGGTARVFSAQGSGTTVVLEMPR
ncbi:sensor histidine kinase [Amnibacterium kyonggiense]|uniref:Signal transduction histidine kinase n=1 Tax=Amnibacterium kyonggiense TaxID=595671 RepID=A0A4R7FGM7_9MICO|nr:ATP-binding protein [Amnibacterium kyonggiense]TDS75865.1 signal transduction histidine kinase [Amnibacterium kyonggiense]